MRVISKLSSLLISLVAIMALSASAEEACWLMLPDDSQTIAQSALMNAAGRLCIVEENIPYVGKTIIDGGLVCQYKNSEKAIMPPSHNFRLLNASYDNLVELIADNGTAGILHQTVRAFEQNFSLCYPDPSRHTHIVSTEPVDSAALASVSEFCLLKDKARKAILSGDWNGSSCATDPLMPSIPSTTTHIHPSQEATDTSTNAEAGTDSQTEEFPCAGYNFEGEAWATGCVFGLCSANLADCTKFRGVDKERKCCKHAQDNRCKTFSQDKSGKCCCGKKLDYDDIGNGNGDNRAYKRQK